MSTHELRQAALTEAEPLDDDQESGRVATWLRRFTLTSCALAAVAGGALVASFAVRQSWVGGAASLVFVGLAILAEGVPKADWLSGVVFGGFALLAAISIWLGNAPEWALGAITASLIGWDLHDFRRRLAAIERVAAPLRLIRGHLRRLFTTALSGVALSLVALYVRISYGVLIVIVLSLLAIFGISRAIAYMRRYQRLIRPPWAADRRAVAAQHTFRQAFGG